jgi:hypothetical protein
VYAHLVVCNLQKEKNNLMPQCIHYPTSDSGPREKEAIKPETTNAGLKTMEIIYE